MFLLLTLNKEILARYLIYLNWQKQSFRGVLRKRCSENMQQTYKLSINWTRFSAWVFSCKFIAYFQNHFFLRVPLDDCFWIESASLIECLRGRGIRLFLLGNWNSSPSNIYLFKFNNRNTRKRCEICSKLTIKTLERRLYVGPCQTLVFTCSKWTKENTRKRCEIFSKLTIRTPERHHWSHRGVFIVSVEHI